VNNTVLSNFARVDRLDILRMIFSKVYITPEVQQEVLRGVSAGYDFLERAQQKISPEAHRWLQLTTYSNQTEEELFLALCQQLDFGEASCLAIAKPRGWLVLTDDSAARKVAKTLTIPVSGTLGVLKLAVEYKIIQLSEDNALLQQMIRGRYHSPINDLSEIIEYP
jgi:hypothetical protein